ncbi:ribose transport system permease protein [Curtobacterium luteum]|uniref:Ribose transport system permease protein n=1 Tax=Curtobacterium luteum TaxID=33881 RepID=A0A8H9KYE6_9MICO|nr:MULTISPECIES: ABC transporter permease [Curtobacterium]MBM7803254.1 ribose transport system permease protein [Curtobacterium luteum]NUU50901.1 ABC transporter permease [Curtobacterium luteum]GGK95238.1 sugar ABC transporter permease [Curtobacterium luteum]
MPKLLWREAIETTTIRTVRDSGTPFTARISPKPRVATLGSIAGRESGVLVVLLVVFGALTLLSDDFLTANNLANLARQVSIYGIIAIGQLLVILTGGIDLSTGSILGLSGAVTAQLIVDGVPVVPAIALGLLIGAALGLFTGFVVTRFKLPPFIATLGMLGIARGIVLVITNANTVQGLPDGFQQLANGTVFGVPNLLILFALVAAAAAFVLRRTVFGRYVYAVGSNAEAARLAGVPVKLVTVSVYVIAGLLSAVGGILLTSRLGAGVPTAGTGFELQAIAACVIGGASLSGARGSAIGAACGALLIGVLNNGGNLLAVNAFSLQIAIGALILVAVAFDQLNNRAAAKE